MQETLLTSMLEDIRASGTLDGVNLVAFSGGVDSSLVAALVHRVFSTNATAVLGVSPSVSSLQLKAARETARSLGIPYEEIPTEEFRLEGYVKNQGESCYHCKTTLYSTMLAYARRLEQKCGRGVVLFNGTNADDLKDPTRVGLEAAREFRVCSPLRNLSKAQVREVSCSLGLDNWHIAASPCLRSRLEQGVPATPEHLARVERAEEAVRELLALAPEHNLRVRHLIGEAACIEVDEAILPSLLEQLCVVSPMLLSLGYREVRARRFKSGGLSLGDPTAFIV